MKQPARMIMVLIVLAGLLLVADFEARCMDTLTDKQKNDMEDALNLMEWRQVTTMQRSWQNYYVSGVELK